MLESTILELKKMFSYIFISCLRTNLHIFQVKNVKIKAKDHEEI